MYFTLIFEDGTEGPSRTYDLVFHPCPVWMKGGEIISTPDPSNPRYQLGHLESLEEQIIAHSRNHDSEVTFQFEEKNEQERLFDLGLTGTTVLVCVHPSGHGVDEDLDLLCEDLINHNYVPKIVDFIQEDPPSLERFGPN